MSYGASSNPQRIGKYELRERLGRGGMAEVWKAFDSQLERYVAIKILHADLQADPEFLTRFTRERESLLHCIIPTLCRSMTFRLSILLRRIHLLPIWLWTMLRGRRWLITSEALLAWGNFLHPLTLCNFSRQSAEQLTMLTSKG